MHLGGSSALPYLLLNVRVGLQAEWMAPEVLRNEPSDEKLVYCLKPSSYVFMSHINLCLLKWLCMLADAMSLVTVSYCGNFVRYNSLGKV